MMPAAKVDLPFFADQQEEFLDQSPTGIRVTGSKDRSNEIGDPRTCDFAEQWLSSHVHDATG
jgi:hypothetical protein